MSFKSKILIKKLLKQISNTSHRMSSMKSFKSRISQKRGDSHNKINMSMSQSMTDCNLNNVFMNVHNQVEFRLEKIGQKILVTPSKIQVTNSSGTRIFVHAFTSKDQFFSISPKKYILQNGNTYEITIKLIQIPYVQFQDYEAESFQVSWGKISSEQIANKSVPLLAESKVLKCSISNKDIINEFLAKTSYQSKSNLRQQKNRINSNNNFLKPQGPNNLLSLSNVSNLNQRPQFARSGLNASDLRIKNSMFDDRPSLLTRNIIIAVALVSFLIGFITS